MASPAERVRNRMAGLIRQNAAPDVIAAVREELARVLADRHCSVQGCDRKYRAKGLCATHLVRLNTHGDVTADTPIPSHGLSRHPLYGTWWSILVRCENPASRAYAHYGARGICICPEWHDVAAFIAWIETNLGPRPGGVVTADKRRVAQFTLDRINNDGNYEPGNVRWATRSEQRRNQRPRRIPG